MRDKKLMILGILGIAAVFGFIYGITASPRGRRRAFSKSKISSQEENITSLAKIASGKRRAKKTNFSFWGRNPFTQKEAPVAKVLELTLNGIIWDEERPKAIINNVVVEVGDEIGDHTVVGIKKDSVILNDGIRNFKLGL